MGTRFRNRVDGNIPHIQAFAIPRALRPTRQRAIRVTTRSAHSLFPTRPDPKLFAGRLFGVPVLQQLQIAVLHEADAGSERGSRRSLMDNLARGLGPEDMVRHYPHLNSAEVHAKMAYLHDHQDEIDAEMQAEFDQLDNAPDMNVSTPVWLKLKANGFI